MNIVQPVFMYVRIQSRRILIGQVNNTLCYFGKLSSFIKYILFYAYFIIVIMDVSYGHCQIVTLGLKSCVLLGGRAWDECEVFRFRLTVFCHRFCYIL